MSYLRVLVKPLSSHGVHPSLTRERLPAAYGDVDVEQVDLNAAADLARLFGSEQRGTGAKESVSNDLAAYGTIQQGVRDQRDRFAVEWMASRCSSPRLQEVVFAPG